MKKYYKNGHLKVRKLSAKATFFTILISLLFVGSAVIGLKVYSSINNIIEDPADSSAVLNDLLNTDPADLTHVGDGRINILLIGSTDFQSEDGSFNNFLDQQSTLTDTLIIGSLDFINNDHGMFSIPRDTWVTVPDSGNQKINNAYAIGESDEYPGTGANLLKQTIQDNFNIPIHYYVKINIEGLQKLVDDVGGITIDVPEEIIDYEFNEQELGYSPPFILQQGRQTLDGKTASFYLRSRKSSARGDFDRNDRQRIIITELAKKMLELNYYNPSNALSILSSFEDTVRTNISVSDMRRFYGVAKDINIDSLKSIGLSTDPDNILVNENIDGAAALIPKGNDYSAITDLFFTAFPDPFLKKEAPTISVLNGSGLSGQATITANKLEALGYSVQTIGNFTQIIDEDMIIKKPNTNLPYSENYLQKEFEVKATIDSSYFNSFDYLASDFIIIVGSGNQNNFNF